MENLGIDFKLMVAQLVNFGLFYFIFKKFISGPMNQLAEEEKRKEADRESALQSLKKSEALISEKEAALKQKIQKEADELMKKAKAEAEKAKEAYLKEAKAEAEKLISKAKEQVQEERQKMEKELKKEAIDISIALINKALGDYLSENIQKDLNKHILNNLSTKAD